MKTKIINLTPHAITIITDGNNIEIAPSGTVARCKEVTENIGEVNGIPVVRKTFGEIEGLPQPQADTIFIVSALVAQAAKREDVFSPGDFVRDDQGRILGCKSLVRSV